MLSCTLRWRYNERGSVSNHQPHDCLLNGLFGRRSKKAWKLRVTGLCAGNSPGTGVFPAQMASNAENVSIRWRHHDRICLFFCLFHGTEYIDIQWEMINITNDDPVNGRIFASGLQWMLLCFFNQRFVNLYQPWYKIKWWYQFTQLQNRPKAFIVLLSGCTPVALAIFRWFIAMTIQWSLSVTTTSIMKLFICDLFSDVF